MDTLCDYVTGREVPNVGAEENRQFVEKYLVNTRGYPKEAIAVDYPLVLNLDGEVYETELDLVLSVDGLPLVLIKCAAASLDSRVREAVAAARIMVPSHQLPFAAVSDGVTALVHDGITGKKIGEGLSFLPSFDDLISWKNTRTLTPLSEDRKLRQGLVFRTYDTLNVNVQRHVG
ncbi:type I restriction and modification enzyme subunit R-like protein [Desulfobotulus alkaliphilus]|uniref:Type I restriction and modification enzyme subunit R-like protein n=1 Tax=Desulfobotulus alkaliphilus TaxID=622671 RepID=A0A562R4E2_9BACT|nr:type I restriction enzyme HsdR N-terminal domain-containing protein [Desulfobotulus alkaliphilus]TWI63925.1 type I restriction and modification enzyme subunit R-like protein [Desulfobotulus alkaliphilus]